MAYKPDDFPLFTSPDLSMAKAWMDKLQTYFLHNIVSVLGIQNRSDVKYSRTLLYEIFTRYRKEEGLFSYLP